MKQEENNTRKQATAQPIQAVKGFDLKKIEKIFEILDGDHDGKISSMTMALPKELLDNDIDLISDILASHSSDELTLPDFYDLLINIGQYEAILAIFRRLGLSL